MPSHISRYFAKYCFRRTTVMKAFVRYSHCQLNSDRDNWPDIVQSSPLLYFVFLFYEVFKGNDWNMKALSCFFWMSSQMGPKLNESTNLLPLTFVLHQGIVWFLKLLHIMKEKRGIRRYFTCTFSTMCSIKAWIKNSSPLQYLQSVCKDTSQP